MCMYRVLISEGLVRVFWSALTSQGFDYIASIDKRGRLLPLGDDDEYCKASNYPHLGIDYIICVCMCM